MPDTPTDPDQAREADGRADREALAVLLGGSRNVMGPTRLADYLIANRDAVLAALGLHEEFAIDKPGMRGINPQRRWATDWEDYTDE